MFRRSLCHQKWKLSLEDHISSVMGANYILLLPPNQYPDDLAPHFSEGEVLATIEHIETVYGLKNPPLPLETFTVILGIVNDLDVGSISRIKAISRLMDLDLQPLEQRFVTSVIELVKKLPRVSIAEDVNESELDTRFIDPFLCGLFDDPDEGMFLRWTNDTTLEARKYEGLSTRRPDLSITRLQGFRWKTSHGYGEAKSAAQGENHFLVCQDLVRVGMFCKDALETQNMNGVLGLQIVGRTITFYVLVLPATGVYVMYELAKVKILECIHDISKLVLGIPQALLVLVLFRRVCVRSNDTLNSSRHCPTMTASTFKSVFSSCQSCKRQCDLKNRHNIYSTYI